MNEYSVLLEGFENQDKGYFINIVVAALSITSAKNIALKKAFEIGLRDVQVVEIEKSNPIDFVNEKVLSVSGKSYYSL